MPINRLHHIGMSVPNLDIGKRFYCDVLGFEEARTVGFGSEASVDAILGLKKASAKVAFLRRGDLWIEMFEFSSPSPKANDKDVLVCEYGFSHLCLDVTDVDTKPKPAKAGNSLLLERSKKSFRSPKTRHPEQCSGR
jgi:catechol 2,3-dioxygenase-like lactoylglutathione lyase family enzyme